MYMFHTIDPISMLSLVTYIVALQYAYAAVDETSPYNHRTNYVFWHTSYVHVLAINSRTNIRQEYLVTCTCITTTLHTTHYTPHTTHHTLHTTHYTHYIYQQLQRSKELLRICTCVALARHGYVFLHTHV